MLLQKHISSCSRSLGVWTSGSLLLTTQWTCGLLTQTDDIFISLSDRLPPTLFHTQTQALSLSARKHVCACTGARRNKFFLLIVTADTLTLYSLILVFFLSFLSVSPCIFPTPIYNKLNKTIGSSVG